MNASRVMDPITTEVIGSLLATISEEMSAALVRTAYSPNIKERADCSTAVFDRDGRVVAQAQRLPMHMGSLLGSVQEIVDRFPVASLADGDMFIANDPYTGGGSHLPDLNVVAPVFDEGSLIGFVANIAHHSDVGGMVAGSESAACTSIYQEGLRLPPMRLCAAGEVCEEIIELVKLNSRTPADRDGDLRAQVAANVVGTRGLREVCKRYGTATVADQMSDVLTATAQRIRSRLTELPDGTYEHTEWMDRGFGAEEPVAIHARVTVDGGRLQVDFAGTAQQLESGRNIPLGATKATVFSVVKSFIDPYVPSNAGFYDAIEVVAPPGCVVNPEPPAAVSARALTSAIVADAVVGALSAAVPDRAVAPSGPHQLMILSGPGHHEEGYFVDYETFAGALGARPDRPGMDAVRVYASGASNLPVEPLEHAFPLLVERYEVRQGSGGGGRHRGGHGIRRDYRILSSEATVELTGERQERGARGAAGGADGAPGEFVLNPGTEREQRLPGVVTGLRLQRGDVISIRTPGGGGYGDPPGEASRTET